jgi:hypothetical protein
MPYKCVDVSAEPATFGFLLLLVPCGMCPYQTALSTATDSYGSVHCAMFPTSPTPPPHPTKKNPPGFIHRLWMQQVFPKYCSPPTITHIVTSRNTITFTVAAVTAPKATCHSAVYLYGQPSMPTN